MALFRRHNTDQKAIYLSPAGPAESEARRGGEERVSRYAENTGRYARQVRLHRRHRDLHAGRSIDYQHISLLVRERGKLRRFSVALQMVRANPVDTGIPGDQRKGAGNIQELSEGTEKDERACLNGLGPGSGFGGHFTLIEVHFWSPCASHY